MVKGYRRFMHLLEIAAVRGVPQMLGTVIALTAIGVGLSMMADPGDFLHATSFNIVYKFASPYAWGTVYIVSSLAVLVCIYTNARYAQAPAFMLGATFIVHGILVIPQINIEGAVPSAIWMYMGVGWMCIILQVICGVGLKAYNNEKTPVNN